MSLPVEVTTAPAAPTAVYSSSAITLYGVVLDRLQVGDIQVSVAVEPAALQAALIYGFSYQGHCYSLPEPVTLVVEAAKRQDQAKGCGYAGAGYAMWVVEKDDRSMLIQGTGDTFEELVLKRTQGSAKAPMSYHSAMQVAHRGGKLMD